MTERFARKVILAVKNGTERELFVRKRRKTAVDDNLRKDLEDYLFEPKISINCPGESVSIAYRQRKEKHVMNLSKEAVLQEFIELEKKNYTVKTLLQYWPCNFVIPSSCDEKGMYVLFMITSHKSYSLYNLLELGPIFLPHAVLQFLSANVKRDRTH